MSLRKLTTLSILLLTVACSSPVPTDTPTPAASPTPTRAINVTAAPPWLAYVSDDRLILNNPDGSGRTVLATFDVVSNPQLFPSPDGQWLAVLNGLEPVLTLYHLPDGAVKATFPLVSKSGLTPVQKAAFNTFYNMYMAYIAGWSPDGHYLAFDSVRDGSSSNLYVYNPTDDSITRLTRSTVNAFRFTWAPDSANIVFEELDTMQPSGSSAVLDVYAVHPDGSQLRMLYQPLSYDEHFLGWASSNTLAVTTLTEQGYLYTRLFNINTLTASPLYNGLANKTAFDPDSGTLAFTSTSNMTGTGTLPAGIYLATAKSPPALVTNGDWVLLAWLPGLQSFFVTAPANANDLAVTPQGTTTTYNETVMPVASFDQRWLAFPTTTGLRVYATDGFLYRSPTKDSVDLALWQPNADSLYYLSNGQLFYLANLDAATVLIDQHVQQLKWVGE
ncbi:MAG TPA: hypothetical protein VMC62_04950 [Longilinea sp.]|nr:hypothetical protein [Longilinea sp.]